MKTAGGSPTSEKLFKKICRKGGTTIRDHEMIGEGDHVLVALSVEYRTIGPDLEKDPSKQACFVCSWHRRKELFALSRELNCNKLAFGHHRNDAVETLLLNKEECS